MAFENVENNLIVLFGVAGPVNMNTVCLSIPGKLLQIIIEIRERMEFYVGSEISHFLPFRYFRRYFVAPHAGFPKTAVMHFAVGGVLYELCSELYLIDLFHGFASPLRISVI